MNLILRVKDAKFTPTMDIINMHVCTCQSPRLIVCIWITDQTGWPRHAEAWHHWGEQYVQISVQRYSGDELHAGSINCLYPSACSMHAAPVYP